MREDDNDLTAGTPAAPRGTDARRIAALTLAYFALAWLMSIPVPALHGALPLGLPAGLALAALLSWGWRCWPGVWLGAALAAITQFGAGDITLVALEATAATLQALLGWRLVHPLLAARPALTRARDVGAFLLLAGPTASLLGTGMGTGAQILLGAAGANEAIALGYVRWIGDSLGVALLASPLLFWLPDSPLSHRRTAAVVLGPLLLTTAIVIAGLAGFARFADEHRASQAAQAMDTALAAGVSSIPENLNLLVAIERFFANSAEVTAAEFDGFCAGLFRHLPISAVDWAPRIPHAQLDQHVAAMRRSGHADYQLFGLDDDARRQPVAGDDEHFPVTYTYRPHYASTPLGLDHAFAPERRTVMAHARDRALLAITEAPLLGPANTRILLAYQPVYRSGFDAAAASIAERRTALRGFVVGVFELSDLFRRLREAAQAAGLEVRVSHLNGKRGEIVLFDSLRPGSRPSWHKELTVGGMVWRVTMRDARPPPPFWFGRGGKLFLLGGLCIGLLGSLSVLGAAGSAGAARALVAERTAGLLAETRRRAQAEEAAQAASRAKSAFLAAMSHEIRTPMNGVVGMAEVLQHTHLTPHQQELVETMTRSANQLLALINDILDFSKIEAGAMRFETAPLNLEELAHETCGLLAQWARDKHVLLTAFVDPHLPPRVLADPMRLRQILSNLLSNAIKFSESPDDWAGRVAVRITVEQAEPLRVRLAVSDNGIGIAPDKQAQMFQPFTQEQASTTRRFGGTGLGLTICQRLAELMGGRIEVQSQPGKGATFTVTLPLDVPAEQPPDEHPDLAAINGLIIDGGDVAAADLDAYLQTAGARVAIAANPAEAARHLDAIQAAPDEWVIIHDARSQQPDPAIIAAFAQAPRVRHVALTRGRRHLPRPAPDNDTIVTLDLNAMHRAAFLQAVAMATGRSGFAASNALEGGQAEDTIRVDNDTASAELDGVLCLVVSDGELDAEDARSQLTDSGAEIVSVPDLASAAERAAAMSKRAVVLHDTRGEDVSLDELHRLFKRARDARHVAITRGRRKNARIIGQEAVAVDAGALRGAALRDAVAVAAGRASPGILNRGPDETPDWARAPDTEEAQAQGRLILVAEDDATNQRVILTQLALLGCTAEIADDGLEALTMWRKGDYALLLVDLHMPNMDGYTLTQTIRDEETESGGRVPILALTANTLAGEEDKARLIGMDGYLTKPLAVASLRAALDEWLPGGMGADNATRQQPEPDAQPDHDTSNQPLDVEVLKGLVGDDPNTLTEMLMGYRDTAAMRAEQIRTALSAGDWQGAGAAAHALKSSSRSVGAMTLGALCETLEQAGKAGDGDALNNHRGDFETALSEVQEALASLLDNDQQQEDQ